MTDDLKRTYARKPRRNWLTILAVTMMVVGSIAVGASLLLYQRLKTSDHAVKALFKEFCLKRASRLADEEAKAVCGAIWEGALQATADTGIFVNPFLFARVIGHESGFRNVIGVSGDAGYAQIRVSVHGWTPFGCDVSRRDCNIYTGARLLAEGLAAFRGDERKALAAYNMGITGVRRAVLNGEALSYPDRIRPI